MLNTSKPNIIFWVITVIALLWNAMGVYNYLIQAFKAEAFTQSLNEAQLAFMESMPSWNTALFAIAVFSGFLGSLALVLKKKWAKPMFLISFVSVVIQVVYNLFIQEYIVFTGSTIILPLITVAIAAFLVWFANDAIGKRILT